jgi:hypothetical protein
VKATRFAIVAAAIATLMGCMNMPTDAPDNSRRLVLAEQVYF